MPNLRENQLLNREAAVSTAIQRAVSAVPSLRASQQASTPDDGGMAGYYEDASGVLTYSHWFRAGDEVGSRKLRPY